MLEYERFNHPEKSQDIAGSIKNLTCQHSENVL